MAKTINGISVASLTETQAAIINNARSVNGEKKGQGADERKQIKREVFSVVKAKHGIPETEIVRAATVAGSEQYLILHTGKKNRRGAGLAYQLGDDGRWNGNYVTKDQMFPPPAPAPVEETEQPKAADTEAQVMDPQDLNYVGDANAEAAQGGDTFRSVAAAAALPDGIRLVSVSDKTVVVEIDSDDWNHDVVGFNGDRHVFTRS